VRRVGVERRGERCRKERERRVREEEEWESQVLDSVQALSHCGTGLIVRQSHLT
jgi:hypothetical protein